MGASSPLSVSSARCGIAAASRCIASSQLLVTSTVVQIGVNARIRLVCQAGIVRTSVATASVVVVSTSSSRTTSGTSGAVGTTSYSMSTTAV